MRNPRWLLLLACALMLAASLGAQFKRADTPQTPPPSPSAPAAQPATDDQVIKVEVALVNLYFTVRDNHGGYVGNLKQDDFEVLEDGQPQTIKTFARETDQPLTLGLLVDVSGSQERLLEDERAASARFFEQVLRTKDEAFLLSFGVESELLQDFTNSHTLLERALRSMRMNAGFGGGITPTTVPSQGRGTVLYEAVWLASNEKMRTEVGRKALVLITDGDDQGSRTKPEAAIEAAQKADSIIYVILYEDPRFHSPMFGGRGSAEGIMRHFTDETGGRTFRVERRTSLNDVYNQLQEELRSQYVIAYTPTRAARDGSFRKVEIRVKDRKDVKVQARKGYYAVAPGQE
ncbi:MAG: VWA domain-containing protein [Bryobacteraceae bacterium]